MVQKVAEQTPKERALALLQDVPKKVMTPIFDDVLVHLFEEKQVSSGGGIYIPDNSADKWANRIGCVIAVGPDCKHVKEGDLIILKAAMVTDTAHALVPCVMPQLQYDNVTYHLLPEKMIAGKLL